MNATVEEVRQGFLIEAADILDDLDASLLTLEAAADDETVHRAFRAAHTLKGSCATLGFEAAAAFAHVFENLLIGLRDGRLQVSPRLVDLSLCCSDHLRALLAGAAGENGDALVQALQDICGETAPPPSAAPVASAGGHLRIRFTPHPSFFACGADPAPLLEELATLGDLTVRVNAERLPDIDHDPMQCWLSWDLDLRTDASEARVRDIFSFYEDDADLRITSLAALTEEVMADARDDLMEHLDAIQRDLLALEKREPDAETVRRLLRAFHTIKGTAAAALACAPLPADHPLQGVHTAAHDLETLLEEVRDGARTLGRDELERLLRFHDETRALAAPAAAAPMPSGEHRAATRTIRVDPARLDRLMVDVEQIMVVQSGLQALCTTSDAPRLRELLGQLRAATRSLHATSASLRVLPLQTAFQKLPRMVRDLARQTGKQVELTLEGEEIELDRAVLERIGDPLMHLVRNAVDHGIEPPDARRAAAKPETGHVRIRAVQEPTAVVLRVEDDGQGLDADRLREKAVSLGLLPADAALSDAEAWRLVFHPGLSTRSRVTDVSGRGVGMDVVASTVRDLHGTIDIDSAPGRGTTFAIRLPAALLVTRGLVVACADERYVVPMTSILELVKIEPQALLHLENRTMAAIRDRVHAHLDLRTWLGHAPAPSREERRIMLLQTRSGPLAVEVDRFVQEVEVVVKPLRGVLADLRTYSGAALAPDGSVLLTLEPDALAGPPPGG